MLEWLPVDATLDTAHKLTGIQALAWVGLGWRVWRAEQLERRIRILEQKLNTDCMFPLKERTIGGYKFRQRTWYAKYHLGVDYKASIGTELRAPFPGTLFKVQTFKWLQGGNQIWFKPDHVEVMIRFMHLKDIVFPAGAHVGEGEVIAHTGNTGTLTTGPHLHIDISRNWQGSYWENIDNFIDPETYDWGWKPEPPPVQVDPVTPPTPPPVPPKFPQKVTTLVRLNVRTAPRVTAPRALPYPQLGIGESFTVVGVVEGESYTIGGKVSKLWLKSIRGNYVAALGTNYKP